VAGRINDEDVQALRERADLAAVVGEYTALKRSGARLTGLCPFHDEKTPSFTVDPARNLYHCFGCGQGGDVYGFLQQIEALTFPEAVERLARLTGFELRYEALSPGQRRALGKRTRMLEILSEAASFFAARLASPDGEAARGYLANRGLGEADFAHFRLGWAPDRWDGLSRHLLSHGYQADEVIDAGLATSGARGPVDRFRGRVIFPILDRGDRDVVAFGGRVLPGVAVQTWKGETPPPKYINSAESEVYRKSEVLYGLNWARAEVQRQETALVVEGYMDVIGLCLAGVRNAVATCGTALTSEHFRQLEKFARKVVLALDADDAGYAAAERARALAAEAGMRDVGVLPLPAGMDPADLAAEGTEAVERALKETKTAVEFQIEHLLRGADMSTPEGQVEAYRRTFPLLARLEDRFLRFTYVRDIVAPVVRLSADLIERELDAAIEAGGVPAEPSREPAAARRPAVTQLGGVQPPAEPRDPQLRLEREVLRAVLQRPDLLPPGWADVSEDEFTAPVSRQLFGALRAAPPGDLDRVLDSLEDDDARARVRGLALSEPTVQPDESHVAGLVRDLRAAAATRRRDELRAELGRLNPGTDGERHRAVYTDMQEQERKRRALLEGRDA
jgi:DNA primase